MKFDFTGLSPNTKRAYEAAWHKFSQWCNEHSRVALPATEQTLVNYVAFLCNDTNCSPSSARQSVAALRWIHRRNASMPWEGGDPLEMMLKALEQRRTDNGHRSKSARVLSTREAELLLEAADGDGHRSSALIALMFYTGVRISELLSLQVSDMSQENDLPILRIVGKGRKRRSLPIIPAVYVRLERYLASRPHGESLPALPGQVNARSQPLFTSTTGKALDPKQVRRILLRCAKRAGLDPEVISELTPHSTRATYATSNLAAGTPLRDVQYALGHEDPRTTEGYDRSDLQLDRHPSSRLAAVIRPPSLPNL